MLEPSPSSPAKIPIAVDPEMLQEKPSDDLPSLESGKNCPISYSQDWKGAPPGYVCKNRIKRDIMDMMMNPVEGIAIEAIEEDLMCVQALVMGNVDTPYEGGFFHFYVRFGPQYPFSPPRVCSMSSYRFGTKVRFNPNLYVDGTVCLSILGTWEGPSWTAGTTLNSLLISIKSLFCEEALCNEPGLADRRNKDDTLVKIYDIFVSHETIRVSVIKTLKDAAEFEIPIPFIVVMEETFLEKYDFYIDICNRHKVYDGEEFKGVMFDYFCPQFEQIKKDLAELRATLMAKRRPTAAAAQGSSVAACSSSQSIECSIDNLNLSCNSAGSPNSPSDPSSVKSNSSNAAEAAPESAQDDQSPCCSDLSTAEDEPSDDEGPQ